MISLWLQEQRILSAPVLYISAYFERYRHEYYDALFNVSATGAWKSGYSSFFARCTASAGCYTTHAPLVALRHEYHRRVSVHEHHTDSSNSSMTCSSFRHALFQERVGS